MKNSELKTQYEKGDNLWSDTLSQDQIALHLICVKVHHYLNYKYFAISFPLTTNKAMYPEEF